VRAAWVIAKREMLAFFVSPVAYVVLLGWMLWSGFQFWMLCAYFAQAMSRGGSENPLGHFFGGTTLFFIPLLVFVPVMTMRLLAEERRSGTIECLLTAPVTDAQVVLGKYLAAVVFWLALWAPTLMYVWLTSRYGDVDLGAVGASYLGILGIGLYYMAIGTLMSAVSRNQIVAAILTFMVLGFLFLVGILEFVFQDSEYRAVFTYVSVWGHMDAFSKGIVDTRFLVFDLSTAALALYLAVRALGARKGA
jgi:ABC-2 type transport system permease protein